MTAARKAIGKWSNDPFHELHHDEQGISCKHPYVRWKRGRRSVVLDGSFSIQQLKDILAIMEQADESLRGSPESSPLGHRPAAPFATDQTPPGR